MDLSNFETIEEEKAEVQDQSKNEKDPLQYQLDNIIGSLSNMPPPNDPQIVSFLWTFLSKYISFLEVNPQMDTIIMDVTGSKMNVVKFIMDIQPTNDIVQFLLNFSKVGQMVSTEHLREVWSRISLDTPEGNLVMTLAQFIDRDVGKDSREKLNELFMEEASKYTSNIPAVSLKVKAKQTMKKYRKYIAPLAVIILLIILFIFFNRNSAKDDSFSASSERRLSTDIGRRLSTGSRRLSTGSGKFSTDKLSYMSE